MKKAEFVWIDVNERLPKKDEIVIGVDMGGVVCMCAYDGNKKWEYADSGCPAGKIVFWTRIPQTPNTTERMQSKVKFYGSSRF